MVARLKPITPKVKMPSPAKIDGAVNKALKKTLETGQGYFKRTTSTWRTVAVVFYIDGPRGGRGSVGTDNDIYGFVTRGTRPHLITPKQRKYLVFGEGKYNPVTRPGVLGSRRVGTGLQGAGGVARPIFARRVRHPGTKARGFEELVATKLQPVLETNVTAELLRIMG